MEAYARALATVQALRPALLRGAEQAPWASARPGARSISNWRISSCAVPQPSKRRPQETAYPQYEWYLHQARNTVEQFKTAELRDYFGDDCVAAVQPRSIALEQVSPDTLIVYPILLPDRTDILVSLPTGLKRVQVPVTGPDLSSACGSSAMPCTIEIPSGIYTTPRPCTHG